MTTKKELIEQTNLAFEFIQKLYLEVSYLIKEIEGLLSEEQERFVIGKPGGYGINARSSNGLEAASVNYWLLRRLSVFFVPEDNTTKTAQTVTKITDTLKVLYVQILLNTGKGHQPEIYSGVLYNIQIKPNSKWIKKFENLMGHLEYNYNKFVREGNKIKHKDSYMSFDGELIKNNLYG